VFFALFLKSSGSDFLASIGTRYIGIRKPVTDTTVVIAGEIYETWGTIDKEIPEDIALGYLMKWRDELLVREGIVTQYMAVEGGNWLVQWKKPVASPIGIGDIVAIIIGIAVIVAITYLARELKVLAEATAHILSVLGPENVTLIVQAMFMFMLLMFMGPFISMIARIPEMIRRRK